MTIATSAEKISPLAVGSNLPDGPLGTMDGQKTTLEQAINGKASIIVFYRGDW